MCGIFGAIRKPGAPRVRGAVPFEAMEIVRHRGSGQGGGFARTTARADDAPWTIRAVIDRPPRDEELRGYLERNGFHFSRLGTVERIEGGAMPFWAGQADKVPDDVHPAIDAWNRDHLDHRTRNLDGRIISCSRRLDVWKDVAQPATVATGHGLPERRGDAWIAHTREPTNSPGRYPIWSHPFTAGDVAIVHNGDISSFGANQRFLRRRGYHSFTGTDSEAIAYVIHELLRSGLEASEVAAVLVDENGGDGDPGFAGAALDGPFSVGAIWSTADETFMLAIPDRQKLRPLVLGEDAGAFYCASEESQIRHISPDATIWTPQPGQWFLASSERGVLAMGRERRPPVAKPRLRAEELATPAQGRRFLANSFHRGQAAVLEGPTGNCLANGLQGGVVVVHGNAADDVGDAMLSGRVVVHGDVRDVAAQAMQGGVILVRGNAGNRVGLQMRAYDDAESPYRITGEVKPAGLVPNHPAIVIGGGVDDHFGEYMAGGTAIVMNLIEGVEGLDTAGAPELATGRYVGTGMVGGRIYIRGRVEPGSVGLPPRTADVEQYLEGLVLAGRITDDQRHDVLAAPGPDTVRDVLPEDCHGILRLFENKYFATPRVRTGPLSAEDLARIGRAVDGFFEAFEVDARVRQDVLRSEWTVIDVAS